MSLRAIVLDACAFRDRATGQSLLSLPMGESTVLEALVGRLEALGVADVLVLHAVEGTEEEAERLTASGSHDIQLVDQRVLSHEIAESEIGDHFLVIDPRYWSLDDPQFELLGDPAEYRGATHVVAVGTDSTGAVRECVERDEEGMLLRVQRWYDAVNWPEYAMQTIAYSRLSARLLTGIRFKTLAELRNALASRGVFSRDVPLWGGVFDLMHEQSYLELNQRLIRRAGQGHKTMPGDRMATNVIGEGCRIDPQARLIAPVIVQKGAQIAAGACIVGPALIGTGVRVEAHARVVQSVVSGGAVVPGNVTIRHRAILRSEASGECEEGAIARSRPEDGAAYDVCQASASQSEVADELMITSRRFQLRFKRAVDIVLSAGGLLVLLPFMAIVAVLVKMSSPGPVLFAHRREGRFGKEFNCWKFRTMVAGAHRLQRELYKKNEVDGPQFKLSDDPRMTRIGRWLRSTNIDELPQLVNVLLGQMSLVGPRPSPFRENQVCVPWRRARLSVRPGISGLWQVCRNQDRSEGDFHEWIYYDIVYVRRYSLWLDIKILIATLLSLGGKWSVPLHWLLPEMGRPLRWGERFSHVCQFYPLQPTP